MKNILQFAFRPRRTNMTLSSILSNFSRLNWIISISIAAVLIIILYDFHTYSYREITRLINDPAYSDSINFLSPQRDTQTPSTTKAPLETVLDVYDRSPTYQIATKDGERPNVKGYHAETKLLENLRLMEVCSRDPSTIVVDVGAYLGKICLLLN